MRRVLVIGIGVGGPDQLTLDAVAALNRVDVFLGLEKGTAADELVAARRAVCDRHIIGRGYRYLNAADPERDRASGAYRQAVADWTAARAEVIEELLRAEVPEGGVAGILAWGDPALYDSVLRILDVIRAAGRLELAVEVVPGISSIQALAAAHRISLTQVGGQLLVTTGRRLADHGLPPGVDDVAVMLDGSSAFTAVDPAGLHIYWGAYLGGPDEVLVAGELAVVRDRIVAVRAAARARKGWIMDVYLLRRPAQEA